MIEISGVGLSIDTVYKVAHEFSAQVQLAESSKVLLRESRSYIENRIASGEVMYGINTGFGAFSNVVIPESQVEQLQRNLIRSHSAGVGEPFSIQESRAIMLLRANTLARGQSGVRVETVEKILEFLNKNVIPVIPCQGSVGASGDLAPLSHLALGLMGEGEIWFDGQVQPAELVLKQVGIQPLVLKAKEGLSLINGCQVMTAVGLLTCFEVKRLMALVDLAAGMSLEGTRGGRSPFDPLLAETRPHPGEKITSINMLKILSEKSPISESHIGCGRVQDAYSFRCIPAVHGSVKNTLNSAIQTLEIEANSSTDNPLVFAKDGKVISCGNFHGEPVAFALDFLAIALTALGNMSERRIAKLIDPDFSELPAFLAPQGGLNSGFMIVQVAAAALASENKVLAHPASVDTIPTSSDKEDHVSMGTIAARKLKSIKENVELIVAMELLSAAQAIELVGLKASGGVQRAFEVIRQYVPFAHEDRVFANDVKKVKQLIEKNILLAEVEKVTGELKCQE